MILRYSTQSGKVVEVPLSSVPVTIGRSDKADIMLDDEKASRLHCGIRWLDNEFLLKDLTSKNGTFLNNERIESAALAIGDRIRIGNTTLTVEAHSGAGSTTAFEEVDSAMSGGKGYQTILKEIVDESQPKRPPQS
jgi:pSer/pThr/pTyr-binding forkhead associated (FHA) protein